MNQGYISFCETDSCHWAVVIVRYINGRSLLYIMATYKDDEMYKRYKESKRPDNLAVLERPNNYKKSELYEKCRRRVDFLLTPLVELEESNGKSL